MSFIPSAWDFLRDLAWWLLGLPAVLWAWLMSWHEQLANLATVVLFVVAGYSLYVRGFRRQRRMRQPLRAAIKECSEEYQALRRPDLEAMTDAILRDPEGRIYTPGDILSGWLADPAILSARGTGHAPDRAPSWTSVSGPLARILRISTLPRTASFLNRILFPEESRALNGRLTGVNELVWRFSRCTPISKARRELYRGEDRLDPAGSVEPFRIFASALSGAAVLVDTVQTRSRFAEKSLVWHSRSFRGGCAGTPDRISLPGATSYDREHREQGCGVWDAESRPPGDYDLRVLDFHSVALGEAATGGYLAFVLETTETCYAATERGELWGCKKVPVGPAADVERKGPRFDVGERAVFKLPAVDPDLERVVLLTSYVTVITSDNRLALVRRSRKVRNGPGVVSASAGGVLDPGDPGPHGHVDAMGMPDPLTCAIKEAKEEIGLDLPPEIVSPVAVFVANIRKRNGVAVESAGATDKIYDDTGQLVAVVLSLAQVPETMEELDKKRKGAADPARGAFEADCFEPVLLKESDSEGTEAVAARLAAWAKSHADHLDQHGLLSLLYAAATIAGPQQARKAFLAQFADAPWWVRERGERRVVVDPRMLIPGEKARLEQAGPEDWGKSWKLFNPDSGKGDIG